MIDFEFTENTHLRTTTRGIHSIHLWSEGIPENCLGCITMAQIVLREGLPRYLLVHETYE